MQPDRVIDLAQLKKALDALWEVAEGRTRLSDEAFGRLRVAYEKAEGTVHRLLQKAVE